jgi:hypothetical protein
MSLRFAQEIAEGAIPEGHLPTVGMNMRACIKDAQGYRAARKAS